MGRELRDPLQGGAADLPVQLLGDTCVDVDPIEPRTDHVPVRANRLMSASLLPELVEGEGLHQGVLHMFLLLLVRCSRIGEWVKVDPVLAVTHPVEVPSEDGQGLRGRSHAGPDDLPGVRSQPSCLQLFCLLILLRWGVDLPRAARGEVDRDEVQ